MGPRARHLRSPLLLAFYVVCTVLVFSFILFDVLDIDGSDFPGRAGPTATPATLSEAAHDIRRAYLQGPAKIFIDAAVLLADGVWHPVPLHPPGTPRPLPIGPPRSHGTHASLPRSALPGPLPADPLHRL